MGSPKGENKIHTGPRANVKEVAKSSWHKIKKTKWKMSTMISQDAILPRGFGYKSVCLLIVKIGAAIHRYGDGGDHCHHHH